jgi:hypothetical protein
MELDITNFVRNAETHELSASRAELGNDAGKITWNNAKREASTTQWKPNPKWPDGREPHAGRRTTLRRNLSYTEARAMCQEWNAKHKPGKMSRKAEFDQQ